MAEKVTIEIAIENAGGAKTVGELKKAIKDLKNEALGVKEGSKEFVKLTAAAAQAKNKMDDLNEAVRSLNPEGKFAAFAKLGGTIASGFQAAQGAAALFGKDSKDLEKTLLKVQAATALSQGIQGLTDIRKQFVLLGNVIKANPLLLIATVVIALGVALYELKDKIKVVGMVFDAIGEKINSVKNFILSMTDAIGITNTAADKAADELSKRMDRLIARGKEIDEQRKKAKEYQDEQKKLAEEAERKRKEEEEKKKTEDEKRTADHLKRIAQLQEIQKYETDSAIAERWREFDEVQKVIDAQTAADEKAALQKKQIDEQSLKDEKDIRDAKLSIAQSSFDGLSALGNIFIKDQKKLEKFNKAAALVQIGIDTAKSISALVAASQSNPLNAATSGFAGVAQFASGIAMILTNIAKAKSILSGSGSSGSAPSLGGGGGVANSQPRIIERNSTGLIGTTIDPATGQPIEHKLRVYVTETDITDKQDMVKRIKKSAILGG